MTRCVCATARADLRVPMFITFSCADGASEVVAIVFTGVRSRFLGRAIDGELVGKVDAILSVDKEGRCKLLS